MRVRPLTDADLDRILSIDRIAFPSEEQYGAEVYRQMPQSGLSVVALDDCGVIVGYAFVQLNPQTHVRSLAVHPHFRRRGFAAAMLQAVISGAAYQVDLLVDEANGPAIALYAKLGFQPAEICPALPSKRRMVLKLGRNPT